MGLKVVKPHERSDMLIRTANAADLSAWAAMRSQLWPDGSDQHAGEVKAYFAGDSIDIKCCYVIEKATGELCGFLELNVRNFAEGSRQSAVPYVEAWFIKPEYQGQGLGKKLMQQAEQWARQMGHHELASDTEVHNHKSIAIHQNLGFTETERVVCFLKKLNHP